MSIAAAALALAAAAGGRPRCSCSGSTAARRGAVEAHARADASAARRLAAAAGRLHAQASEMLAGGLPPCARGSPRCAAQPVVINKWASWCEPCRAEFGVFQRVSLALGGRWRSSASTPATRRADAPGVPALVPGELPELLRPERPGGVAITDSTFTPVTVFYDRRGGAVHPPGPLPERGEARSATSGATRWTAEPMPELRIDPLSGHRTIVAGERSRRPGGEPALRAAGADRRRAGPVRRGPRGPHAARALRGAPGRRRRPTRPAGRCGWCRTCTPRSTRPAGTAAAARDPEHEAESARGQPELFIVAARARARTR